MRKTSQDGDSTSITSGVEHEFKKTGKPKKSSLKRKPPSNEVDDTVIEPLINKEKERTVPIQCAKSFFKPKTEVINEITSDKGKLLNDAKLQNTSSPILVKSDAASYKESVVSKPTTPVTAPIHNYMNTNIFNNRDASKTNVTTKTQILVEIDGSKTTGFNSSPLIFTTAKIHTDGKSKHMEPVQVTPVPILSTIEASLSKGGNVTTNEKKISNGATAISTIYSNSVVIDKVKDELDKPVNLKVENDTIKTSVTTTAQIPCISNTNTTSGSQLISTSSLIEETENKSKSNTPKGTIIEKGNESKFKTESSNDAKQDLNKSTHDKTKPSEFPAQIPVTNIQTGKVITEKVTSSGNASKEKQLKTKDLKSSPEKAKSIIEPTISSKSTSANKQLQKQKTQNENVILPASNVESKIDNNTTTKKDGTKPSDAKIVSSAVKTPNVSIQAKTPSSHLRKESDKIQKSSANEVKPSVTSQNITTSSSTAPRSNKTCNVSNANKSVSKPTNVTTSETPKSASKSFTTEVSTSSQNSSKSEITSVSKITPITTTKATTSATCTAVSVKTTQTAATTTVAPSKSLTTGKSVSSKVPTTPKASKLPVVSTGDISTVSASKSSTSKPQSVTKAASSTASSSSAAANGIGKIPELNTKGGGKPSDPVKENKSSKA